MAELFSRWESGLQVTAGPMIGSKDGASGLNAYADRLNSIAPNGSQISGTNVSIYTGNGVISGTNFVIHASGNSSFNKISYYGISPGDWHANDMLADITVAHSIVQISEDGRSCTCPINLPHGAVVTNCIVYGSESDETWTLVRCDRTQSTNNDVMASATFGTAVSDIDFATIDNSQYSYAIYTTSLDTGDEIYGGTITYTTDYN
ncbi:MAG: hypothetical protein ACTSXD_05015 [Candidatus Heimdallarchaeaceae archaeon]